MCVFFSCKIIFIEKFVYLFFSTLTCNYKALSYSEVKDKWIHASPPIGLLCNFFPLVKFDV